MSGIRPTSPSYVPPVVTGWHSQIEQQQARRQDPPAPPAEPVTPPAEPVAPEPPAYVPPASQADMDRIIQERVARERARYSDYADLQARAARVDELEAANQTESERAVTAAREEGRAEMRQVLAAERVRSALTTALIGRNADPVALLDLDRSTFITGDTANTDAIQQWVEAHSSVSAATPPPPPPATVTPDPSQGAGGASGSVEAGRAAYERRHPKTTT